MKSIYPRILFYIVLFGAFILGWIIGSMISVHQQNGLSIFLYGYYGFSNLIMLLYNTINPSEGNDFVIQVLTFHGLILAIAIPLSFEMISRMSERYESDVISRHFRGEIPVRLLTVLLLLSIIIEVLVLFISQPAIGDWWKPMMVIILVSFLSTIVFLVWFVLVSQKYVTGKISESILKDLFNEAGKTIKK